MRWIARLLPLIALLSAPALAKSPAAPARDAGPWWQDDVFYQVFVRSFADSDGDGVGDFKGLTAKLDVLNDGDPKTTTDLGVRGIWLMPMHPSPSYHGYDVTDYRGVNPDYGTMADFERFLAEARKRGIRVIIDFVLNHSSREHPWFVEARKGPHTQTRDYYIWRGDDPGWTQPWSKSGVWHRAGERDYYYGLFWGGMPDLNLANPKVEQEMLDAMRFWLDKGVAGFRVDAARHFFESADGELVDQPQSHALVKRLRAALTQTHPEVLLVGEVWTDSETIATYVGPEGFHLAFGFGTAGGMREAARDGVRAGYDQAQRSAASFPERRFEAPFLANHDMQRVMRTFKGDMGAMRVAAAALFGQPGTPFVYYGEEIGMQGGDQPRDEDKRTPMRWTADGPQHGFTTGAKLWHRAPEAKGVDLKSQRGVKGSLWTLFRDLIALRDAHPALSTGAVSQPKKSGGGRGFTALLRGGDGGRILCLYNFAKDRSEPARVTVAGKPDVVFAEGFDGQITRDGDALVIPPFAGRGFAFVRLGD